MRLGHLNYSDTVNGKKSHSNVVYVVAVLQAVCFLGLYLCCIKPFYALFLIKINRLIFVVQVVC